MKDNQTPAATRRPKWQLRRETVDGIVAPTMEDPSTSTGSYRVAPSGKLSSQSMLFESHSIKRLVGAWRRVRFADWEASEL